VHDFVGRVEAEHGQVADIQLDDLVALFLHLAGLFQRRAANFVADVVELVRFQYRSQNVFLVQWRYVAVRETSILPKAGDLINR
jgi:hypothetical protein